MSIEELVLLAKNLHDHFHLERKLNLTNDEYRVCKSLLAGSIDLRSLYKGLHIIKQDYQSSGFIRISKRS